MRWLFIIALLLVALPISGQDYDPEHTPSLIVFPERGHPLLLWGDYPGASWYEVYFAGYYRGWQSAVDACAPSLVGCAFQLRAPVPNGRYLVALRAWGETIGFSDWDMHYIEYHDPPPQLPDIVQITDGQLAFTVTNYASWYRVWAGDDAGSLSDQWHSTLDIGCAVADYVCHIPLTAGVTRLWLRAWGPGGLSDWRQY